MSSRTETCYACDGWGRIDKETPDGDVVEESCTVCSASGRRVVDTADSGLNSLALYDEEWN